MSSRVIGFLLDLLFPPRCVFCEKLLKTGEEHGLCAACQRELPWLLDGRAERKPEFVSLCVSPLRYQDNVRRSIHRYKFSGHSGYAGAYGRLTAQCVQDHLNGRFDLITWVPISRKRLKQRGYDQTALLARAAAGELGCQAVCTLRKTRENQAQSGLKEEAARKANVLGVYAVTDPELVAGKRILLIDDVVTTGSTLSECARTLRTYGAADVVCAALAAAGTAPGKK